MLTGIGTAGAYHAGVFKALAEAGIKIDLLAAHGIGAGTAVLGAVDGGGTLWDAAALWRSPDLRRFYRLRPALRAALLVGLTGGAVVGLPLLAVAAAALAYPAGYLVQMVSPGAGIRVVERYEALVSYLFQASVLPTLLPRASVLLIAAVVLIAVSAASRELFRRGGRRQRGPWWARVLGMPWTAGAVLDAFAEALGRCLGLPARGTSSRQHLGRRYAEVLSENLGQPGFRELLVVTHDLDARSDLTFAMLADPFAGRFFARERDGQAFDLGNVERAYVMDALAGAVSLPVLTPGHQVTFPVESYWRGETHLLSDRPGAVGRVLDEAARAGATQVIVVSAWPGRGRPHELVSRARSVRARVGEYAAGLEVAALREALAARENRFEAVFVIAPTHNAVGPLDFRGTRDERSDRVIGLGEVMDRGYRDAFEQFIDPVLSTTGDVVRPPHDTLA